MRELVRIFMADVVRDAQHEFWRRPLVAGDTARPGLVEVCDGCATEFMVGSLFCHVCGASREARPSTSAHWTLYLGVPQHQNALWDSPPRR